MTRLALLLMWLLHWLPLPALAACGRLLGRLFFIFGSHRRRIVQINLDLCFKDRTPEERSALARRHFEAFGRSLLERGLLWWSPAGRIRRYIHVEGRQRLDALKGRPAILLVPHFVGLDCAWTRLSMDIDMSGIYANQNDPVFNAALYKGRARFGKPIMLSRHESLRRGIKAIRSGYPFFYLPDLDHGRRDSIFVPFFGVQAATLTGLARLARLTGASVLPVIARMTETACVVKIGTPLADFPGDSIEADTRRMNALIESEVLKMPEQYYWLHRRFKTRPPGEQRPY